MCAKYVKGEFVMRKITGISSAILCFALILAGCGGGGGGTSTPTPVTKSVNVNAKANFQTSVFRVSTNQLLRETMAMIDTCPVPAPSLDSSGYNSGLDCDGDGGLIRYVTPSSFKVAFKKLTFVKSDGTEVDIIADKGTLANSTVYDLTSEINIATKNLSVGTYPSFKGEIYYYEIKMAINNPSVVQSLRVYLSDDDFAQEGSLGHHQGDITFIDNDGNELGWVPAAEQWTQGNLLASRGSINGAGGTDPETGHLRGLFGNTDLWNQADFMQGNSKDIYIFEGELNLTVSDTDKIVTLTFDLKDSWFYEDFDNNQLFNPCDGTNDACAVNAEWAPIFKEPSGVIQ